MAAAQSLVTIQKFGGTSSENWTDFESLFRSLVEVANIDAAQRVGYLKLQLKDSALQFFHTLDNATRGDLELTLTALKNHFCNPNLKEIHHINLENLKFNLKTESPEEFLVKLQNLALKAYPTPVDLPVAPVDNTVANDQDRFDRETRENTNRRNFAQMERERHIIRLFKKAMPNFIRLKLLEEPETATIQELCTKARQKLILRELCPVDDWSRDGFNEMSNDHSEKLLSVLTKMSENQNALEDKMNALTEKVTTVQNGQNDNQNHYNNYKNNRGRGNYRGRNNNNRGNRGGYYQNNQGNGRYGNNYNRGNNRGRGNWRGNNRGNYSNNNFSGNNYQNNDQNDETTVETTTDTSGHVETTQFSQVVCYSCGYPNHTAKFCVASGRGRGNGRGGQILFNTQPKN